MQPPTAEPAANSASAASAARALAEFELGEVRSIQPLGNAGSGTVRKVVASTGTFVLKPAYRLQDVELQAEIAPLLTASGVRQPKVIRTATGRLVTSCGYFLLEFLTGSPLRDPPAAQVAVAMRHVGEYHRVLGELPVSYEADAGSLWTRVADPAFLIAALPSLLARHRLADDAALPVLDYLDQFRTRLAALPRQVVHGDIGPDNILMDRTGAVVSLIDFTPHLESVMFAASAALYWFHVYGRPAVTPDMLRASLASVAEARPWTSAERAAWPASLAREALRRLATALELSGATGRQPGASALAASAGAPPAEALAAVSAAEASVAQSVGPPVGPRLAAVHAVARLLPQLA